jgi:hypothetical protein
VVGFSPKYLHNNIQQDAMSTNSPVVLFSPFTGLGESIVNEPQILANTSSNFNLIPQIFEKYQKEMLHTRISARKKEISKHKQNNTQQPSFRKMLEFAPGIADNVGFLPWEKSHFKMWNEGRHSRKLLDTFAESLLHVNRLYNREFGFEARRVPAHMAHLMDKTIMTKVQER